MSETAAEKLLSKFFQISIEEARTLIDLPVERKEAQIDDPHSKEKPLKIDKQLDQV